jgi:hypothetical protein
VISYSTLLYYALPIQPHICPQSRTLEVVESVSWHGRVLRINAMFATRLDLLIAYWASSLLVVIAEVSWSLQSIALQREVRS